MEDKLELKHLAPYLPYKLMVVVFSEKAKVMIASGSSSSNWVGIGACVKWSENCKPILRPLSDFNPIGWYDEDENEIHLDQYTTNDLFFHNLCESEDIPLIGVLKIMEALFEQHYDVFGLIEKGLAIDINTINE